MLPQGTTVTQNDIADALCNRATVNTVMAVTQWVCHQREFAEAQSRRIQEVAFRENYRNT